MDLPLPPEIGDCISLLNDRRGTQVGPAIREFNCQPRVQARIISIGDRTILICLEDLVFSRREDALTVARFLESSFGLAFD